MSNMATLADHDLASSEKDLNNGYGKHVESHIYHRNPATGELDETVVLAEGEDRSTFFVWLLVGAAAIGGLLFGYDTGVIGGVLVHKDIASDLRRVPLSSGSKEIITSATTLGALIGGGFAGLLADRIGRKKVIILADVIFIVSAVIQAAALGPNAYWIMATGRLIVGFAVGIAALVVPLVIQELSPTAIRGRLTTLNVVAITFGQVVAYLINLAFRDVNEGWRAMVALGALPPVEQLVQLALLGFMPESPRYLLRHGRMSETLSILRRIYPFATEEQLSVKARVIEASVKENMIKSSFIETWKKLHFRPANLRGLIIACGLQGIQQFSGFNTLIYYAPTLFQSVGFKNSLVIGLVIAITNFVFTLLALAIIEKVGRRRIACWTIPGMTIFLILASISFHYLTLDTGGKLTNDGEGLNQTFAPVVLVATILYVACYATGIGNLPWQQGELLAYEVRGLGVSISTSVNWGANLIIGATFLSLIDRITAAGAFGFYAGLCFLGSLFCFFLYPETSGLSIEETQQIFSEGFGVAKARKMRAQKVELLAEAKDKIAKRHV